MGEARIRWLPVYRRGLPGPRAGGLRASCCRSGHVPDCTFTVEISEANGLDKRSIADCLQTRPIDARHWLRGARGRLDPGTLGQIDEALRIAFGLCPG